MILRRVRADGSVDVLGTYRPRSRELLLDRTGFPLTAPGRHAVEGDLPWVFDEIAPDGFLASRFAAWFPELALPERREYWSPGDVLAAIARRGHDLTGNLLVGDETYERYRRVFGPGTLPGPTRDEAPRSYPRFVRDILSEPAGSSVGGARPKFALRLADGAGLIVKFTPPLSTEVGRRWADLLRMEAHAATVLREAAIDAVHAGYLEREGRGFLEIERFDRLPGGGRRGHVTLYYLNADLYGETPDPERVVPRLVADGHLTEADAERFRRVHAFSRAIANDDAHLGNYGLVFDDEGRATLAPAYDVLPMALAPRHDELPDAWVRPVPRADPETARLVERLLERVETDPEIGDAFRGTWLRAIARP